MLDDGQALRWDFDDSCIDEFTLEAGFPRPEGKVSLCAWCSHRDWPHLDFVQCIDGERLCREGQWCHVCCEYEQDVQCPFCWGDMGVALNVWGDERVEVSRFCTTCHFYVRHYISVAEVKGEG